MTILNRSIVLTAATVVLFLFACPTTTLASKTKPNFIIIFADDQGYQDLSCYGSPKIKTPNIDRMAKEGVRFTDFYVAAPICTPSRAALLTGCYPSRVGLGIWVQRPDSRLGLHPNEITLAELLKQQGYATGCIGKWHLGFHQSFVPNSQGFDYYFGLHHNLDLEADYFANKGGVPILRNSDVVKRPADPAELTQLYTKEAIAFINRNKDRSFFLYLPHTMAHLPLGASKAFRGKSKGGPYGDAIEEIDWSTGQILDTLKKLKIDERTIVIYTSDNGPGRGGSALPLRGRKLTTYEGGVRVPCIVWGPGHVAKGKVCREIATAMDFYPTLGKLAGAFVPTDRVIDGKDIYSLWTQPTKAKSPHKAIFYHGNLGELVAVRAGKWKLFLNPQPVLYDLETDIGEKKNVVKGNFAIVRELRNRAIAFQENMLLHRRPVGVAKKTRDKNARTIISSQLLQRLDMKLGLTYARYGDRTLALDLYRPNNAGPPLPAIVCIHGGGWAKGHRKNHGNLAKALAARGFVTVTISYRLSGETPFPAAIHDCKAAVRWLRANAVKYNINPKRIGAIGLSAGGHLTALLATSADAKALEGDGGNRSFSSTIQAAVAMGAQTDLESQRTRDISKDKKRGVIWRQFLGGSQGQRMTSYRLASPLHHLDKSDPPIAFITGEKDDPSTRADRFRSTARKLSVPTALKVIGNAPHPFLGRQVWFDECVGYAAAFFTVHLKGTR